MYVLDESIASQQYEGALLWWQAFGVAQIRKEPLSEEELAGLAITMGDFEAAVSCVQPSVRREGFATTPDVTWNDVGALREVRDLLV